MKNSAKVIISSRITPPEPVMSDDIPVVGIVWSTVATWREVNDSRVMYCDTVVTA